MMLKTAFAFVMLVSIALSGTAARATIADIVVTDGRDFPVPTDIWSFDQDLQVLTLTLSVSNLSPEAPPFPLYSLNVTGSQDAPSILTVVENVTNQAGTAMTGYGIGTSGTIRTYNEIVAGSVQATGSPEVYGDAHFFELVWPQPILDGGAFTVQFDVLNYWNGRGDVRFGMGHWAVPEPATMILMLLGGLTALRTAG